MARELTPVSTLPAAAHGVRPPEHARLLLMKFVNVFETGGTERQAVNLGLALDPEQFAVQFGCLSKRGEFLQRVEERGIPTTEYPIRSFFSAGYVRQTARLARDLRRAGTQIVHAYTFYANVFAIPAARAARVPVVIASIRDRGVYLTPWQKAAQKHVCRLADCVLVNADSVRDWLIDDGYDAARIVVIKNGIDLSVSPSSRSTTSIRAELGLAAAAPLVGAVGRVTPSKGLDYLLEAAVAVCRQQPEAHFLVIGGGPDVDYQAALQARARAAGIGQRMHFLGHRSDVRQLLEQLTVSVLPSLSEAMPNAVLESMAVGLPVVATNVGGVPEAVEDGVTGFLVPSADGAALAAAINRLLDSSSLAAQMGQAAQRAVRARFSMDRMRELTVGLYRDLAARNGVKRRPHRSMSNVTAPVVAERQS